MLPAFIMRLAFTLLFLLCTAVLASPALAAATPVPGVAIRGASAGAAAVTKDLDQAKAVGAKTARIEVAWSDLEPAASGQRDPAVVANLDAVVQAARLRRIGVILLVQSTPCWTTTAPATLRDGCRTEATRYPPSDYRAFGRLAAFLADRYRGGLAALEIWNEPDQANEKYWAGPDKARRYAALVRATYPLVKAADPRLPVLAGAFVGKDGRFLQALYNAGMKGFYDGLSVHFYDLPLLGLRQTRVIQRRNGDRKPMWLLETGWNSCAPVKRDTQGLPCVTRAHQAQNLRELFARVNRTSYLKALVVYKLRDDGADQFGVLSTSAARKPSFAALRGAFTRPTSKVRRPTLRLRSTSRGLQVSGTGPDGDLYRVEVRRGGVLRYRAVLRLDSTTRFSLRVPSAIGTRGLRVRLVDAWRGGSGTVRRT